MVKPVLDNELYDIYSYWHVPWWQTRFFYATIMVLVFVLMWYGMRKLRQARRARASNKTPWQKALEALDAMRASQAYRTAEGKQVYFALTSIMKTYVYERFGLDVAGKTDDELIAFLRQTTVPVDYTDAVQEILQGSVLVRFARGAAIKEQIERDVVRAYRAIEHTIKIQ